LWPTKAEFEVN